MSQAIQQKKPRRVNRSKTTTLTDVLSFPAERNACKNELRKRLIIDDPVSGVVADSNPPISFWRVTFGIRNPDGTEGDIVIGLDRCFCFGVQESKDPGSQKLNGYSMAIAMYDQAG